MSSETRSRFLAAIGAQVGPERVEEAHIFPPIRQGGTENGVAVVAVRAARTALLDDAARDDDRPDAAPDEAVPADPEVTPPHGDPLEEEIVREDADPLPAARDDDGRANPSPDKAGGRLTVYTAKYRLTLKGPDRGKWEFAMQAEADAPLITVETVVRGVQRRSGDVEDPEKLSGEEFRAQLPASPSGA